MAKTAQWYLVRTKPLKERWVCDQLCREPVELFLPLLKMVRRRKGKVAHVTGPLFPCYLFVRMDLSAGYFKVKYTQGVRGIICAGREPLAVPEEIVDEIKERGAGGVVEIKPRPFHRGEKLRVAQGPFRDFQAIFERYLSGAERVAVLLETVEAKGIRMVLPAEFVSQEN